MHITKSLSGCNIFWGLSGLPLKQPQKHLEIYFLGFKTLHPQLMIRSPSSSPLCIGKEFSFISQCWGFHKWGNPQMDGI